MRDSTPVVSLGMPVFNGERYLATAVGSVLAQTFEDFELLICDNASTDATGDICRSFAGADPRVRYVRNPENLGAHPNFNRAFELATGRYFKWASHDDALHPGYLRACVDAMEQNTEATLCQSDIDYIDEAGNSIGTREGQLPGVDSPSPAQRFSAIVLLAHDCQAMMGLFRREQLARSRLLPSFLGADRAMLAQVALFGRFIRVPEALIRIRDHGQRYSQARKRPKDRAAWHDTSKAGKTKLPVWTMYRAYWSAVASAPIPAGEKARARLSLFEWWFRNYNAARMGVDLVGSVFPGFVGTAERFKQSVLSPAPGPGQVRGSRRR
jgi:glycosyltransferase involved in cell wall biosynthesis